MANPVNLMPHKLKAFNLFVDGRGYAGLIEELELPKLNIKTEEHRSGGMDTPMEMDMGMEKLEANFTLSEYDPNILRQFGFSLGGPITISARGALQGLTVIPIVISMRGRIKTLDMGAWKAGDSSTMKFSLACNYYRLNYAGADLIEIDVENMVRIVGGEDQLAAQRAAVLRV